VYSNYTTVLIWRQSGHGQFHCGSGTNRNYSAISANRNKTMLRSVGSTEMAEWSSDWVGDGSRGTGCAWCRLLIESHQRFLSSIARPLSTPARDVSPGADDIDSSGHYDGIGVPKLLNRKWQRVLVSRLRWVVVNLWSTYYCIYLLLSWYGTDRTDYHLPRCDAGRPHCVRQFIQLNTASGIHIQIYTYVT
jgi:hypothetical protein